jgi:hypothetical protein
MRAAVASLGEIRLAFEALESGHTRGKIVVRIESR